MQKIQPVILIILDGFGIAPPGPGNAISLCNPSNINSFTFSYPNTTLRASGEAVGLPSNEVGNTEVGHINIGAGHVVYQDLPRINMSIADGGFYKKTAFTNAINHIKKNKSKLHLIGLVGTGSVHSNVNHMFALLYFAKEEKIDDVFLHLITDGRDSPPKSALEIIGRLEQKISELKIGKIASIMGRYYAMDRDHRWERTEKAYISLTEGIGRKGISATQIIKDSYSKNITDEFIEPSNVLIDNKSSLLISDNDAVIFFNYRIDRPRQLTKAFVLDDFENANKSISYDPYSVKYYKTHFPQIKALAPPFKRTKKIKNLCFVTMTEYEKDLSAFVAFPPIPVINPLGKVLADLKIKQLRITESEKERFVTYYFNGLHEIPYFGEERIIIPSPKVATYDLKPEMSSDELTEIIIKQINTKLFPFILVNFPNPDMVGHTGNLQSTIMAIGAVDRAVGKIVGYAMKENYTIFITGDHGNAEEKINPQTGGISTEHTNNSVPFIVVGNKFQKKTIKLQPGILADIAPTILTEMNLHIPKEMTGRNLLEGVFS